MYVSSSSHHHVQIVYGGLFSPVCSHLSVCKKQQPHLQTIHYHPHGDDHDGGDDDDDKDRKNENKMKYLNIQEDKNNIDYNHDESMMGLKSSVTEAL